MKLPTSRIWQVGCFTGLAARRFSQTPVEQVVAALDEEVTLWGFEGTQVEWDALHTALGLSR